jgi:hypothetical protein
MSITIVNGYVCTSCCDEAKAKQGKDPNAPPGTPPGDDSKDKASGLASQPATVLGGILKDLATANAVTPASAAAPANTDGRPASVNLLV